MAHLFPQPLGELLLVLVELGKPRLALARDIVARLVLQLLPQHVGVLLCCLEFIPSHRLEFREGRIEVALARLRLCPFLRRRVQVILR